MKYFQYILFCLLLTGCTSEDSSEYLLSHPKALKKIIADCQFTDSRKTCKQIIDITAKLMILANEQRENPEQYGNRIIDIEILLSKTSDETTRKELDEELQLRLAVLGLNGPE